jgi:hypothetical protein
MHATARRIFLFLGFALLAAGRPALAASKADAERFFVFKVLPLLKAKCFACHGDDPRDVRGDFDIRSRKGLLRGGDSGEPAVVPGSPDKSPLFRAVQWKDLRMPPKQSDQLTDREVAWLRAWIGDGAPWPDDATVARIRKAGLGPADGVRVATSGGQSPEWTERRYDPADLWAFRPVKEPAVPGKAGHPVDAFLNRKLAEAGLMPAGRADRRSLIRRVTFDLTGLPPTPAEVEAFLKDDSPDAWEKVVDRLLASKHYGEQAARHWLDVVRYADTAGFSNDFTRPHAWRYRDYVVRAFNDDLPYNRFVAEQLAGDELDPSDPENLIAVGFLRMGPWEHTGMSVAAVTRQQFLDDVTNSVGVTFLAMGMRCCKCHDHKFDPLPTRDYYSLQAVFAPVQFADRDAAFLRRENTARMDKERARVEGLLKDAGVRLLVPEGATEKQKQEAELGVKKIRNKNRQLLQVELERHKPLAMSVYNGPGKVYRSMQAYHPVPRKLTGELQDVFVLAGGSLAAPKEKVGPGVLSAVASLSGLPPPEIPEGANGRRLALARWITDPRNPLTARVMVNRLWQQHFGTGLAKYANNFGKMGQRPSHPQLLDWLATRFMADGWSVKKMHRLLVTSEAYRRAGAAPEPEKAAKVDPDNRLLSWFGPRRLTAEELRDGMLAISGEWSPEMGGIPARPEIHPEVALQPRHVMGSVALAYQPSHTPGERNRRTLYALRIRTLPDPMLEVFDRPGADTSCEKRDESTITPQVFSLFNGRFAQDRALALAARLEREAKTPEGRVERAWKLVYGRAPSAEERKLALEHLKRMTALHAKRKPAREDPPRVVVREMVEEMTGLKFRWEERLDVYEDYVPDLKPWDVGPETRALADLCLVLFNSNEFAYVY